jgi:acyl carrier protein
MDKSEILNKVSHIFIDTLNNDDLKINEATTANDVAEWDSLSHILLVVAIEKYFKIRFTSKEIQSWENVGEIINSVQERLSYL